MKIIEHIEDLNLQTDDIDCQNEAKKLHKKYSIIGNALFYLGVILSSAILIFVISISIYAIVERKMIYWHILLIIAIFISAIIAIVGRFYKSLAKMIVIKE